MVRRLAIWVIITLARIVNSHRPPGCDEVCVLLVANEDVTQRFMDIQDSPEM